MAVVELCNENDLRLIKSLPERFPAVCYMQLASVKQLVLLMVPGFQVTAEARDLNTT